MRQDFVDWEGAPCGVRVCGGGIACGRARTVSA
jgi:hypothetical protein